MPDIIILLIISAVAIALMAAFPHVCCPIYLAITMLFMMNEGQSLLKFGTLFPTASVLFIGLMASPASSSIWAALGSNVPSKSARFGAHIATMLCLTYGGFIAMARWAVSVHENPGFLKILLVIGVSLLAGFVLASVGTLLTMTLFTNKEEAVKKAQEEAEQARLAAEQARLEAEQAAKIEAERQRIAAEQTAKQRQMEAEAEARRLEQEAAAAAVRERARANRQAILDFWDILVREYSVSSRLKQIAIDPANFIGPLNQDVPEIWVKNDERIAAIENILQAAGFYYTQGEREPAYPYESPLLEKVLYASDPLETNVKDVTHKKSAPWIREYQVRMS